MPIPITLDDTNSLISEEQNYNIDELTHILEHGITQLNEDQLTIFNKVINAVESENPSIFFVDGPGGTEKIFLYNHCIAHTVASFGIASLLLPGG
ncbi:10822_t:CDS:2, partial [Cetraspora pellucida]